MPEPSATAAEPVFPDPALNVLPPKAPGVGRVVSNDLCMNGKSASFVRHTVIDVSGTPLAGNFHVGQSFGVVAPGEDADGKPHKVRLYSIACPSWGEDGDGNHVSTTPKRLIDETRPQRETDEPDTHSLFLGVCSNYLCDLVPGDEVTVTGPAGKRFLLPVEQDAYNYLFVAAGTGIAPFRGMVMELLHRPNAAPCSSEIHLVMGSPYTTDLLYHDLFTTAASEHAGFHYHTAISRERRADGSRGLYVDGLIREQFNEHFRDLVARPNTLIYICGLLGMDQGIYRLLAENDLADGYITVKDELADVTPSAWGSEQMKRYVRPTRRCMVEVY